MKKSELKKILKPIVKECVEESIKKMIFENGILSQIIKEVMTSIGTPQIVEQKVNTIQQNQEENIFRKSNESMSKISEERRKALDLIGKGSYNGVNIFEGTTPMPDGNADDGDPGLDITNLMKIAKIGIK